MAPVVLDASVLIAFLDPEDDLHLRARSALAADDVIDEAWVVPATVGAEMLVGAFRKGPDAVDIVERFLDEAVQRVEPATAETARSAARIRADHPRLSLADAFVLGTAEVVDAELVVTSDRGWTRVSDAVRVV